MQDKVSRVWLGEKEIILVPTAHVSQESVALVREVIEAERPDSVCIELDERRYESMTNPKEWERTDLVKVIKNNQAGYMLANLALSSYQKRMADKLGTNVGGEMAQGIRSAEAVGAELVLADRDIQTTFLRVWRKLSLWEKSKLIVSLFFGGEEDDQEIDEEELARLMRSDILEGMLADMKKEFPKIGDILIHERDQYLSDRIKNAPGSKVVAVLGGAHVPGVLEEIHKDVDMAAISALPPKKPIGKIIGWAIPIALVALIVYGFFRSPQTGLDQLLSWFIWSGGLAAVFTLLVLGHPLSILTSLVMAPFSVLNPVVAVGWFSGLVQAAVQKPTVQDLYAVQQDIFSFKGFFTNKVLKVLLVVIFANVGASIGTFIAGAGIISSLFG